MASFHFHPARRAALRSACCAALGLSLSLASLAAGPTASAKSGGKAPAYSYFVTGTAYFAAGNLTPLRPLPDTLPTAVKPLVLMGGGPDVDSAYRWMIDKAGIRPGTGGRFVVIRTTGTDAYDPYLLYSDASNATNTAAVDGFVGGAFLGLTAAETLIIPSLAAANDAFVNKVLSTANAVWIAGGDQSTYLNNWKGSALQATLQGLIARGVPIGGTSAGANVLGEFIYSAQTGSVTSAQALSNPFNKYMSFDPQPFSASSFLAPTGGDHIPALSNTFVDPHFDERDRMGRLVSFMSRSIASSAGFGCAGGVLAAANARGIGLGVETALLIQGDGSASLPFTGQRVTNISTTTDSAVYFVAAQTSPALCQSGKPLTVQNMRVKKLADSSSQFNLSNWQTLSGSTSDYDVSANAGVLTSSKAGGGFY